MGHPIFCITAADFNPHFPTTSPCCHGCHSNKLPQLDPHDLWLNRYTMKILWNPNEFWSFIGFLVYTMTILWKSYEKFYAGGQFPFRKSEFPSWQNHPPSGCLHFQFVPGRPGYLFVWVNSQKDVENHHFSWVNQLFRLGQLLNSYWL